MDEKQTENLIAEFPTFFPKNFYFECGPGWSKLITSVARFIVSRTPNCHAAQIKEKFGSLRIYVDYDYDTNYMTVVNEKLQAEIQKVISIAEAKSTKMCEVCGIDLKDDNRYSRPNLWIGSICADCGNKQYAKI